jgi:hypothetical protein
VSNDHFDFEPMVKPLKNSRKKKSSRAVPENGKKSEQGTQPQPVSMAKPRVEEPIKAKPKKPQKNVNAKKQFRIPLPNGVTIKLPAIVLPKIDLRILSGAIALCCIVGLYFLIFGQTFRIQAVGVEGLERISAEEVTQKLNLSGRSIFTFQPEEVALDLALAYNELIDINVVVEYPAQVTISAKERKPLIHLTVQDANANVWIDKDGISFDVREGAVYDVVEVVAEEFLPAVMSSDYLEFEAGTKEYKIAKNIQEHHLMTQEMVKAVLMMDAIMPENTVLLFDSEKGLGWQDPQKGWLVYFGFSMDRVDEKLLVYDAIVSELESLRIEPYLISVEHLEAPYYRLEP